MFCGLILVVMQHCITEKKIYWIHTQILWILQRHKNILRELKTLQRQENLRFEAILGKRVSEFKKSGGSFQLLSQTLNGLCLPGNPECSVGDESSTYGSNSVLSGWELCSRTLLCRKTTPRPPPREWNFIWILKSINPACLLVMQRD